MLGGTALVGGQEVVHAEEVDELGVQARVGRRPGVRVVGDQHGSLLLVAHRVDTRVGEHVQEHVGVLQQEGVVARRLDGCATLLDGEQVQLLDDPHLVHLEGKLLASEECHRRHGISFYTLS